MGIIITNPSLGGAVSDPLTIGSVFATSTIRNSGVEQIFSATKPTTRVNGSALVIDDLWYDTATNTIWFWNGTFWLSLAVHYINSSLGFASATNFSTSIERIPMTSLDFRSGFFVETMTWNTPLQFLDATNYWSVQAQCLFVSSVTQLLAGSTAVNLQNFGAANSGRQTLNLVVQNITGNPVLTLNALFTKFGAAGNLTSTTATFAGRVIAP